MMIFLIALSTALSLMAPTSVAGEVHSLISSLTSTGRMHTCTNEPLTFICEVEGSYLQWVYNSIHRTILFSNQRVDTVQAVSGQEVKAILTKNNELEGTSESRRSLCSALLIQSSLHAVFHNVSCSSDANMQIQNFRAAEVPNEPYNLKINYFAVSSTRMVLSVRWNAPNNIDRFDLAYYTVQASIFEQYATYIVNGTTTEEEYFFDLNFIPVTSEVSVKVTAVSKCADYSQTTSRVVKTVGSSAESVQSHIVGSPRFNASKMIHSRQAVAEGLLALYVCGVILSIKSF